MKHPLTARYWIETPCSLEQAAAMMAGEQSSGTFVKLKEETDDFSQRHSARVVDIKPLGTVARPSLPGARSPSRQIDRPYRQAEVTLSWPAANLDPHLPTLMATVAGNLFELNAFSGLKLLEVDFPDTLLDHYSGPRFGISGTRDLCGVSARPILGTIIKPSVGLSPEQTSKRVSDLIESGLDFIKDDELMGDPPHSPFEQRVAEVMRTLNDFAERHGRKPMYAFNVSGDLDQMKRRRDTVVRHGGTCVMASLNWVGLSAMQAFARDCELPIHGHRNGWGLYYRSEAIGISYQVWQKLWRLVGVDHLHCNGLRNKFCESDESVARSARACLTPMGKRDDRAMPVISSGQWAGQVPDTYRVLESSDFMYLCGGGIVGHPDGAAAGVASLKQAWDAAARGVPLAAQAETSPELKRAIEFFQDQT